jgi:uncharacterized membrane protein
MEPADLVRVLTASFAGLTAGMWALIWWRVRHLHGVVVPMAAIRSLAGLFIFILVATVLAISQRAGEPINWASTSIITVPAVVLMLHASYAVLKRTRRR